MKYTIRLRYLLLALFLALLFPNIASAADTPIKKFVTKNKQTYYYDSSGTMKSDELFKVGSKVYYASKSGSIAKNKFITLDNKLYFFDKNGVRQSGWITYKNQTYYGNSAGIIKSGELFQVKGKTYYAAKNGVIAKNKFVTIDNKRYFFDKKGVRQTGWVTYKDHTYYCPESGSIYQRTWKKIGSYYYYFNSSYYISKNTWVDGYYVNKKGQRVGKSLSKVGEDSKNTSTGSNTSAGTSATKKVIKMSNIKQYPQLPTGCESVALTMVLKYHGFKLGKTTIASSYLPKSSSNFVTAFWGSPFSSSGGGIYASGLTKTANKYLKAKKSSLKAYDISGIKLSNLYPYIDAGIPVVVWNSMYMRNPVPVYSYYTAGKRWTFYQSEHCVVLCGYDKKKKKVLINDPLSGLVWRSTSSFERIYNKLGKMAVVIQ